MDLTKDNICDIMYAIYERAVQDLIELAEWYEKNYDRKDFPIYVYFTTGEIVRRGNKTDNFTFMMHIEKKFDSLLKDALITMCDDTFDVIFDNKEVIYRRTLNIIKKRYPTFYQDKREYLKCIEI